MSLVLLFSLDCKIRGFFGRDYRGTLNETDKGEACIPWKTTMKHVSYSYWNNFSINAFGLEENYCREPSWYVNPWCYTNKDGSWGNCSIPNCDEHLKRVIKEDIPGVLNLLDNEITKIGIIDLDASSNSDDFWVSGYEAYHLLLSTEISKANQVFESLLRNGKSEELYLTLAQLMQGVERMNFIALEETDQRKLKSVASMMFAHLEKEKNLFARKIFKAVSVEHSKLLKEYEDLFTDSDTHFESCINDGWIDAKNCKALTDSFEALHDIPNIDQLSNHPVHIVDSDGNLNPSALIPFCRVGGKLVRSI